MITIQARNVNEALPKALELIQRPMLTRYRTSRNGSVLAFDEPVSTMYTTPTERVLFSTMRNANPVFHLMESLWMLAGRNDTRFPATFVQNMKKFSDNGDTLWGAYGFRWRQHFGYDQLTPIIAELKRNPESRRCVLQMWDAKLGGFGQIGDLNQGMNGGLDVPCNTCIYFDLRDGNLNMTVSCRSNDIMWGCYGANAVHMSVLQEYMAAAIGVPVGWYHQMSNDLHLYIDIFPTDALDRIIHNCTEENRYAADPIDGETFAGFVPQPLILPSEGIEKFDEDLTKFFNIFDDSSQNIFAINPVFQTDFFNTTVMPMFRAWRARKNFQGAPRLAEKIASPDWAHATKNWMLLNFANKK